MVESFLQRVKEAARIRRYRFTGHGEQEREADRLAVADVLVALLSTECEVVEYYPNDPRGESALLLGFIDNRVPIHIVIGWDGETLTVITVYRPDLSHWDATWRIRKT
jgi:hypothetical protein